jgi:tetratricopeptide (TPR) repeat protein
MLLVFGGTAWADDWADCKKPLADVESALRACTNVIRGGRQSGNNLASAYAFRGAHFARKGNYDQTVADETKAIELNPRLALAFGLRGAADGYVGNYDQGIADTTRAIELNPRFAEAYAHRGYAYQKKGEYEKSVADATKAIELNPQLALAHGIRGSAYRGMGDYDRDIADQNRAIELKSDFGSAYYERGEAYATKGDQVKALADFRAAVRLSPAFDPSHDKALVRIADLEKQLASAAPPAANPATGKRVALVIGNSTYRNVAPLINPTNDATLIAGALKADGFDVTVADNLDRDGLIDALKVLASKADEADWAVVYFAGHGIEMGGTNYLVPVDAKLLIDRDVELEAVPTAQVMHAIDGARQLRVVILDACRNNPFADTMKRTAGGGRDIGRGLARIEPARGTLVLYSAKEGTIAADGDGANSPFAMALAKHLTEPGIEVDKMFRLVIDDVFDATANKQEPFMYGSLPGWQDFYFRPRS